MICPTFCCRIQRLTLYHLQNISLYIREYKGHRFKTCEISHTLLENTRLSLYHFWIIPHFVAEYKGYTFNTCKLSHSMLENTNATALILANLPPFCCRIQRLPLYHLLIIPLSVGEYKGYRFTTCELSHFLLEYTKATALTLANYPTFWWGIQSLPLYHLRIIPLSVGEYKGYRFTTCELSHFLLENTKSTALTLAN